MRIRATERRLFVAAVLTAIATSALVLGRRPLSIGQEQVPVPAPSPNAALPAADSFLGVASCASPACHGGPDNADTMRQRGKSGSAYTVWVERDKHAKAFSELYSEKSKRILQNLDHLDGTTEAKPYLDARCLACHSTVAKASEAGAAVPTDGVGCESCHGAARGWIVEHTARTWLKADSNHYRDPRQPAADMLDNRRMVKTPDMAVRAGVCADCHVGSPAAEGRPLRNMDHDMIAAGHPRLTFELGAFLANMPHHWDDSGEKARPDYAAHVWAVGQLASTEAALRLLAVRAKAAEAARTATPGEAPHWPELSEYECYACHHGLSLDSYRQKINLAGPGKPGRYTWGTWYRPSTRLLAGELPDGAAALAAVDRVAGLMDKPAPQAAAICAAADSAAQAVQAFLIGAKKAHYDRQVVDRVLLATKDRPAKNWDEACGQYLLFRSACSQDPRFKEPLAAVRKLLQFRDEPQEHRAPIQYNSPYEFDPRAVNERMNDLRALLQKDGKKHE